MRRYLVDAARAEDAHIKKAVYARRIMNDVGAIGDLGIHYGRAIPDRYAWRMYTSVVLHALAEQIGALCDPDKDYVWRLDTQGKILSYIGYHPSPGNTRPGVYENLDTLPEWLKDRVAVLRTLRESKTLYGYGRRIGDAVFWIVEPEGDHGDDTRGES